MHRARGGNRRPSRRRLLLCLLTAAWLDKITREARVNDKRPMIHLRFTNFPDDVVASADWVVIPADVFDEMRRVEDAVDG